MLADSVASREYTQEHCFLCAEQMDPTSRSKEHVFPKWLQRQHNLWNKRIGLINDTDLQYRQLTAPCCTNCNSGPLSELEGIISTAVAGGPSKVRSLPPLRLFQWIGKLFYGCLYRELFLRRARWDASSETIASPELLQLFEAHLLMLQSIRGVLSLLTTSEACPWTIYVYEVQPLGNPELDWDYKDDIRHRAAFVRMNNVGVLAAFDYGAIRAEFDAEYSIYLNERLHPLQFEELGAKFFYRASLLDLDPKLMLAEHQGHTKVLVLPIHGLRQTSLFRNFVASDYARVLCAFVGAPLDIISPAAGLVMTWLSPPDGNDFMPLDLANFHYRGMLANARP